ncbi:MAG: hypothetical protein RID53_11295 [Coleofasciculus sp. B1-GNL1-01]|uniref:hypothetical protein n=1 Tax=Coleofasciculus sp. B1-GNL1-01 TaxID=3068484 RepID=UPI0032F22061
MNNSLAIESHSSKASGSVKAACHQLSKGWFLGGKYRPLTRIALSASRSIEASRDTFSDQCLIISG